MAYLPLIPSPNLPRPTYYFPPMPPYRRMVGPVIEKTRAPTFWDMLTKGLQTGAKYYFQDILPAEYQQEALRRQLAADEAKREFNLQKLTAGNVIKYLGPLAAKNPSGAERAYESLSPGVKLAIDQLYPGAVTPEGKLNVPFVAASASMTPYEEWRRKFEEKRAEAQAEERGRKAKEAKGAKREKTLDRIRKRTHSLIEQAFAAKKTVKGVEETVTMPRIIPEKAKYVLKQLKYYRNMYPELRDELDPEIQYIESILEGGAPPPSTESEGLGTNEKPAWQRWMDAHPLGKGIRVRVP